MASLNGKCDTGDTCAAFTGQVEPWRKWVVLVAVYLESIISATINYSSGVLYVALLDRYEGDAAKASVVVSIGAALLNVLAPIGSFVVNRYSCRVAIVTGGVLLAISRFLSAFATNLDWLLLTYGVLGGIGFAMTYPITAIVLGFYFDKHRDFVISMSVAMVGFGMFAASPLTLWLLNTYGLSGTFIMFSAITLHMCIIGTLCKPSPVELGVQKKRFSMRSEYSKATDNYACKNKCLGLLASFIEKCDVSVLKVAPFVLFQFSNLTWMLMMGLCANHLPNYASIHGATDKEIILVMSCFSISNVCGRFVAALTIAKGKLKHKSLSIQMCMLGFMGTTSLLFPVYSHFEVAPYLLAVVTGICTGGPNALATPITLSLVGVERISSANGYGLFFGGFGILIGPPIAGFLYGQTDSYNSSFIFGGCACLLGFALSLTVQILRKRENKSSKEHEKDPRKSQTSTLGNGEASETLMTDASG